MTRPTTFLSLVLFVAATTTTLLKDVHGFTVAGDSGHRRRLPSTVASTSATTAESSTTTTSTTSTSDFGSAMPSNIDPHDKIGVSHENLALGIDAEEFLEWIGTRNDVMDKFQSDNPQQSIERVSQEVDKFLMDAEMVNGYIKYLKEKKANPRRNYDTELEAELSLSNPKTVRFVVRLL